MKYWIESKFNGLHSFMHVPFLLIFQNHSIPDVDEGMPTGSCQWNRKQILSPVRNMVNRAYQESVTKNIPAKSYQGPTNHFLWTVYQTDSVNCLTVRSCQENTNLILPRTCQTRHAKGIQTKKDLPKAYQLCQARVVTGIPFWACQEHTN